MEDKLYAVFAGDDYYPFGGMGDFQGRYDTVNEAIRVGLKHDWYEVMDIRSFQVVERGRK